MAASNVAWGIEVGAGAIKAVKLERAGDKLNVLDFVVIPHKKVLSTPDLDQTDATRVAIGELVSRFDLTGATVAISVPGHSAFARFAKLPPVEPKKIPDIVKFEAVQQIPFPIDDVEWDYQTFQSPDNPDVEVGIFAITRDRIMERLALWEDVGVTPDYVTLSPIAAYNALAYDMQFGDKTPGTVILDVGTTSTDLVVCEPGRVWVRTFQLGGHNFTEALVSAFKLSYQKAEALKRQAEQSKHARHVFQAMRPVFSDLAQDVQRSIGYYQSGHRDANLTRLIGLGSTFNLPGLRKYLSQQLQMEVVRLEQFNRITVDGPASGEFQAATLNLATAYGLALQGLGFDYGIMVNLMPVMVTREAMWKGKVKWFGAAAGLSIAAGALTFARPMMDQTNLSNTQKPDVIVQVVNKIKQLKGEWTRASGEFKPDYKAANVAGLVAHREVHASLLNDLGTMMALAAQKAAESRAGGGAAPAPPATPVVPAIVPDGDGLKFREFTTTFVGSSIGVVDEQGNPIGDVDPSKVTQRVECQLQITTTDPNWSPSMDTSIRKWLYDNAKRDTVSYDHDTKTIKVELVEVIKSAAAPGDPAGAGEAVAAGGDRGFGRGAPVSRGSNTPDREFEIQPPTPGMTLVGGAKQSDIDVLAPLPKPPADVQPGDSVYRLRVRWDVQVRKPVPAEVTK